MNLIKQEMNEPANYNAIIEAIARGATKLNEISTKVMLETSNTSTYLKALIALGLVEKESAVTEKENRKNAAVTAVFLALVLCGGLAIHQYALTMDHHGVVPYRCILNQPFYQEYLENLDNPQEEPVEPAEEAAPIIEEPVDTPPPATSTQPEMPAPQEENELPEQNDVPEGMPVEVPLL